MKIFKILILCISLSVLSCTDDVSDTERDAVNVKTAPELKSPGNDFSMVLSLDNADDFAVTFVWDYAEYSGTNTVINYSIEFDAAGENFASPTVVATSTSKFKEFKVSELNQAALDAGFPPFEESSIDVRVKSTVGNTGIGVPQYSNHYTIKLTPYPAWPNWGIIGSATPTGWDSDTNMEYDLSTKIYYITMDLTVGAFKFRLDDSWSKNYGDDGNNLSLEDGGADIPVSTAGTYLIKANFGSEASDGIPPLSYTITLQ
jgi:hypothetical protein